MAKDKRFPSDANKPKAGEKPKAAQPAPAAVTAPAQNVVPVEYKRDNHHILSGVHSLIKGINQVPSEIWAEAKKHPSVQRLLADGHAVELIPAEEAPAEEEDGKEDADEAPTDPKSE